jgi:hypothetical protein
VNGVHSKSETMNVKPSAGDVSDKAAVQSVVVNLDGGRSASFPGPWSVESTEGGHLVVRDADGIALAYVYVQQFGSLNRNGLSSNQALAIAESIARIGDPAFGTEPPPS